MPVIKVENNSWNYRFMDMAELCATWSKDPSMKVGAVAIKPDNKVILSTGWNGLPRAMIDDHRIHDREWKLNHVVHAEENCILNAARVGVPLEHAHMYVTQIPCIRCAVSIVQVGISRVIVPAEKFDDIPNRWRESFEMTVKMMEEAKVEFYSFSR